MTEQEILNSTKVEFQKTIDHMKTEFGRLQVGRASSVLVEGIPVDVYGATQPLKAVANISIPDPRTIQIQPWDKNMLVPIEKAIVGIGTGLNPQNDGIIIRISIPPLTEERRRDLSKHIGKLAEEARISIRNIRQDAQKGFKQLKADNELTEDGVHEAEEKLQNLVSEFNKQIEESAKRKETDIMTV